MITHESKPSGASVGESPFLGSISHRSPDEIALSHASTDAIEALRPSFFEVLHRRKTVALTTFLCVTILSLAFAVLHKVQYGALSHVVLVNDSGRDPTVAGVDMPTIVTGSTVLLEVQRQLGLRDSVSTLRKAVNARVAPKSSLMTIAVKNHDPQLAMKIDNAVADTFAKLYWRLAGSRYDEVMRRLTVDVENTRARLRMLDRRLETASANATYVGSQASLDAAASHLGELEENRGLALAQIATDRANLQSDHALPGKTASVVRHEILSNNAAYREMDTLAAKDLAQFTTTRANVTSIYPGIAGFLDKTQKEQQALDALRTATLAGRDAYSPSQAGQVMQTTKDEAAVQGDQVRIAAFDQQIQTLKEQLSEPQHAQSIGALRAERDVAEAQLQALSLRLSNAEANSAEATSLGQVVVVDRATEARPGLVGPVSLFALGLIAAVMLAMSSAYLAEMIVPRLLGPSDVEAVYGRPILAKLGSS
jgi:capsular polysaccharide biosynthesis protein